MDGDNHRYFKLFDLTKYSLKYQVAKMYGFENLTLCQVFNILVSSKDRIIYKG